MASAHPFLAGAQRANYAGLLRFAAARPAAGGGWGPPLPWPSSARCCLCWASLAGRRLAVSTAVPAVRRHPAAAAAAATPGRESPHRHLPRSATAGDGQLSDRRRPRVTPRGSAQTPADLLWTAGTGGTCDCRPGNTVRHGRIACLYDGRAGGCGLPAGGGVLWHGLVRRYACGWSVARRPASTDTGGRPLSPPAVRPLSTRCPPLSLSALNPLPVSVRCPRLLSLPAVQSAVRPLSVAARLSGRVLVVRASRATVQPCECLCEGRRPPRCPTARAARAAEVAP